MSNLSFILEPYRCALPAHCYRFYIQLAGVVVISEWRCGSQESVTSGFRRSKISGPNLRIGNDYSYFVVFFYGWSSPAASAPFGCSGGEGGDGYGDILLGNTFAQ